VQGLEFLTDPKIVKMLAHPLRLRLLMALQGREASPSQLADELGVALGTVSYHMRILHEKGFIKLVREEQKRGAMEHYYAPVQWVISEQAWKNLPDSLQAGIIGSALSQIGEDVFSAASAGGFDAPHSHLTRDIVFLDEEGANQLSKEVANLMDRALAIEAESKARSKNSREKATQRFHLVLMFFSSPEDANVRNLSK
jgi:DNA-binding transcriptional ArsR family regulator